MSVDRKDDLAKVIAAIQKQWGTQAIGRSSEQVDLNLPHLSTGYPHLDAILGRGGIPCGRISELMGISTSGKTTLALKIMAGAQAAGGAAVYLDLDRTFDPAYAGRCGVMLERLTLVHPYNVMEALNMLPDFARSGAFSLLVCDMPARSRQGERVDRKLASMLGRALVPLSKGNTTLLFLTTLPMPKRKPEGEASDHPPQTTLPHFTTLRLLLQRERWLYRQRDVIGYEVQVIVVKNKLSAPGKRTRITIFPNKSQEGYKP